MYRLSGGGGVQRRANDSFYHSTCAALFLLMIVLLFENRNFSRGEAEESRRVALRLKTVISTQGATVITARRPVNDI